MATIEDLPIKRFQDMSDEELLASILAARSRRRNPPKEIKEVTIKKAVAKKKQGKAAALKDPTSFLKGITPEDAQKLLAQLRSAK